MNLIEKDPNRGDKNRIIRKDNMYIIPGWISGNSNDSIRVKYKKINKFAKELGYTSQILFDILVLGITSIEDRPKCPICGRVCRFENFTRGYGKTCSSKECVSSLVRENVSNLWKNEDYRNIQISSHKEWASIEENKQSMRNIMLDVWKSPSYRDKVSKSHQEFAKNHPEKIKSGISGKEICTKSKDGKLIFDSTWEQKFIKLCDKLDIVVSINRADFTIDYTFQGKICLYKPDFIVLQNNKKILVELKANWMIEKLEKTKYKIQAGRSYVDNSSEFSLYLLMTEDDLFTDGKRARVFNEIGVTNILTKINTN